ncbi:hypothetical protein ACOBQX_14700 [Actinokineospora sp. G85]|uniref:hypothetical protein n=1 Tax=Actinokineospora sp. G85 TaxID=3406626 RepID=UPI003C72C208
MIRLSEPVRATTSTAARPAAVDAAFAGALLAAGITGALLVFSTRALGLLGLGAALSALVAAALAFPLREGRSWARAGVVAAALLGALGAPAAANAVAGAVAPWLGCVLVACWMAVVVLLLRVDSARHFARRS